MPLHLKDEMIRSLAEQGFSLSKIAGHFQNCTRNAVISRVQRVEAKRGKMDRQVSKAYTASGKRIATDNPVQASRSAKKQPAAKVAKQVSAEAESQAVQLSKADAFKPLEGVSPLPIVDLPNRNRCRWPVDVQDSSSHFACGAGTVSDTHVYCATHRLVSMGRQPQGAVS